MWIYTIFYVAFNIYRFEKALIESYIENNNLNEVNILLTPKAKRKISKSS